MNRNTVIRRSLLLSFTLPAIIQGFTHGPAGTFLQGIYGKFFGLSLTAIGTAILIVRVLDAATDPAIGYFSDWLYRRSGSRKPLMVAGTALMVLSLWFLYRPHEGVTALYFGGWFMLTYVGWTMTEIAYRAWSIDLTDDYADRTRISTWLGITGALGAISFFLLPYLSVWLHLAPTTEVTPQTLSLAAIVTLIALPIVTLLPLLTVPDGKASVMPVKRDSFREVLRSIFKNRPLLQLTGLYVVFGIATGMCGGLNYFVIAVYFGAAEKLAGLILLTTPLTIVAMMFWGWAGQRFEKHTAWAFATLGYIPAMIAVVSLPAGPGSFPALATLVMLVTFLQASIPVIIPAMLGDVADYGRLHYGQDRTGTYYAFYAMMQKATSGLGVVFGLYVADQFGFSATSATQSEQGILGLKLAYAYIPAVIIALVLPFIWRYPLSRREHGDIVAKLHADRESPTSPSAVSP